MDLKYNKHLIVVSFHLKTTKLTIQYRLTDQLALECMLDTFNFINATLLAACQELKQVQLDRTNIKTVRFVIYLIKNFVEHLTTVCKAEGVYISELSADSIATLHSYATGLQKELEWIFENVTNTSYKGRKEIVSDDEYKMLFDSISPEEDL